MRTFVRWPEALLLGATVLATACGGDGPSDPNPDPDPDPGSLLATVTGDGTPLAGVTVELYANGAANPLDEGTTAANGQVLFQDLAPAEYEVEVAVPAGLELAPGQAARRDVMVLSDEIALVTFALQETVAPTEGRVRARVMDGTAPVEDVAVTLYPSGGALPVATESTQSDGRVLFDGLTPGVYDVEIDLPVGYTVADGDTTRKAVTVTAGVTADVEFGVDAPVSAFVEVQASGTSFTPEDVTISVGGMVRWVWVSNPHTVTPTGHSEWSEAMLDSAGDTFEHVFDQAGTYNYRCTIHTGMTGVIRVED